MKNYFLFLISLILFFVACEKKGPSCFREKTGILLVQGNNQTQYTNTQLPVSLKIQLVPLESNYCTDIIAHFSVLSGGGTLSEEAVAVDNQGYAECFWTLGSVHGLQQVRCIVNKDTILFDAHAFETMIDPRDGQVYEIITIGTQTWMAENLRYDIPNVWTTSFSIDTFDMLQNPIYGRLYDWATLMSGAPSSSANPSGIQGICPLGWHVPSDAEFSILEIALGMDPQDANTLNTRGTHGLTMKSTSGWDNNANGNNNSGFNVFPSGRYGGIYNFYAQTQYGNFKSSTESSSIHGWGRECSYLDNGVNRGGFSKAYAGSCRCVKD